MSETVGRVEARQSVFCLNSPPVVAWRGLQHRDEGVLVQTDLKTSSVWPRSHCLTVLPPSNVCACTEL